MPRFLERLSYSPPVLRAVRTLHLQRVLRELYFRYARPSDGIVSVEVGGLSARFYVRTRGELRNLSPAGGLQGERHILEWFIAALRPGDVFYDIGANVGLYSVLVAKTLGARGQVIAFEPEPGAYAHLQDNLELNGVNIVRAFSKALGARNGSARLYGGDENADSSLVGPPTGKDLGYRAVEMVDGDRFVEAGKLPPPRAVKIDVEGYEYEVLTGLRRTLGDSACELVCCEVHPTLLPPEVSPQMVLDLLKSLGFEHIDVSPRRDTYHARCRKV